MDLFQQFKVLDGGETFGTNEFVFRSRYFVDRNAGMPSQRHFPKWEPKNLQKDGFDTIKTVQELIKNKSFRATKDECLDLPPEVVVTVPVQMGAEQEKLYSELKRDFITYYQSQACVVSLAITKLGRLMEITSGFITTEGKDGRERTLIANNHKLNATKELLESITEDPKAKVIIWSVFRHTYTMLTAMCDELGLEYVEVHGGIAPEQKIKNVERFQGENRCRVFIGHPGSGGIGINLTRAAYDITYSRNHSLADHLQARARNHRGGSKEAGHDKITHYEMVCAGTIDELALEKLSKKLDMSESLLADIARSI
jgi:SNF2 family DNA or RNA helicase